MSTSEELLENVASGYTLSNKFKSKSSIDEKWLSFSSHETGDEDLRITGVKVNIEPEKACNFGIEKGRSKSADVLRILEHSTKVLNGHSDKETRRQIFEVQDASRSAKPQKELTYSGNTADTSSIPILELKLASLCENKKEFEFHINSKIENQDEMSETESSTYSDDWHDADTLSVDITEDINKCNVTSGCNDEIEVGIGEVAAAAAQTKAEIQTSCPQTPSIEVCYPKSTQETYIQTKSWSDAPMSTDIKEVETIKVETDTVSKTQKLVQTEKDIVSESAQNECATRYFIDRCYDASTQIDSLANATSTTDFNIYMVDKERHCDQDVDMEDLPHVPLIVAKKEIVKADYRKNDKVNFKCCNCTHLNQNESIPKCCYCTQRGIMPLNPSCSENQQSVSCSSATCICNLCHCSCKLYSNKVNSYNIKSNFNNSSLCCCDQDCSKHSIQKQEANSKNMHGNHEAVQKLIPIQHFCLPEMQYCSIKSQEKPHLSRIKVVKDLNVGLKMKMIRAVQELREVRAESAVVLIIPVTIQHFLTSYRTSAYSPSELIINPIDISYSVSQSKFDKASMDGPLEADSKSTHRNDIKDDSRNQLLMFSDGMKTKSVVVTPMTSLVPYDDKHAHISLCRSCYVRVQHVIGEVPKLPLQQDFKLPPCIETTENLSSASPKFKRKNFDYTSKEPWEPLKECSDEIQSKKIEAVSVFHFGKSSSEESIESFKGIDLNSACEIVNDHLLNLRTVDENKLKRSAETLHKEWFEAAATKHSSIYTVRNYLRFFEEFSYNLLKTLLHSVDNNGNNVLHFAFANNRFDLVEELLRCGYATDLLTKDNKSGNSPLMICAISEPKIESDWSIVRKSFEMGDVDIKSVKSGQTPLMNAASCGSHDMVELLLNVGANLNLQDKDGSTALMYAAEHGHEKCAKVLVGHKTCDPTLKDKDGQTACSVALDKGHKNIALLIHMQSLEKRRLSRTYSSKRYVWTSNSRKKVPPVRHNL